ncbi:hypothetical protein KaCgl_05220 [Corynebacterium glutamicum]|nr:hypothetical protein KaCgl_05220 [Corynebacterium glutamicum]GFK19158.1 hypothetical protein KbCgl_17300 [Corynebacterium glutamicum]
MTTPTENPRCIANVTTAIAVSIAMMIADFSGVVINTARKNIGNTKYAGSGPSQIRLAHNKLSTRNHAIG